MSVSENLKELHSSLPEGVTLVAVSKTKPNAMIEEAYAAGQRVFGENKVQDLLAKQPELPDDIQWHFIGHIQTNKVKFLAPFISMLHGVDSLKLLKEINKHGARHNRKINCLLQFHIAAEETKFGLSYLEAAAILQTLQDEPLPFVSIVGVMGMGTFTDDIIQLRREFRTLHEIFIKLKTTFFENDERFKEISMGMSGDYHIAIEEGSTMIRIGTTIFGERNK